MLVVPDQGEVVLLDWTLRTGPEDVHLHLYRNDYSPTRESLVIDFTECNFVDYAALLLDPAGWSAAVLDAGAAVTYWGVGFQTWTTSGTPQNVYGYYVTKTDDVTLLWAERFAAFQTVSVTNPVLLRPVMRGHSEVEPAP